MSVPTGAELRLRAALLLDLADRASTREPVGMSEIAARAAAAAADTILLADLIAVLDRAGEPSHE